VSPVRPPYQVRPRHFREPSGQDILELRSPPTRRRSRHDWAVHARPQHEWPHPSVALQWAGPAASGPQQARLARGFAWAPLQAASPVSLGRELGFVPCAGFNLKFHFNFKVNPNLFKLSKFIANSSLVQTS
jgi:hypothetical protein